jgi:hypothetical protein
MSNTSKISALIFAVVVGLAATGAVADVPPGSDLVGIYTAPDGSGLANQDVPPFSVTTVYLCLTGCQFSSVYGWELRIRVEDIGSGISVNQWDIQGDGTNGDMEPGFAVVFDTPLLENASGIIVLMAIEIFVMDSGYFYLELPTVPSIPDNMAMLDGSDPGNLQPIHHPLDDLELPVFGINTGPLNPQIATDTGSWSAVKGLFR